MVVTEKSMRAAYRFLKDSVFDDVALPSVDSIQFKKKKIKKLHGFYEFPPHRITIDTSTKSYQQLLQIMAHEMLHVALEKAGACDHEKHTAPFVALADAVCIDMGWPKGSV